MEFPFLLKLPLSEIPLQIVSQFLRRPHPAALLIKQLQFYRILDRRHTFLEGTPALSIEGDTVRRIDLSTSPPRYVQNPELRFQTYCFDLESGEYSGFPMRRYNTAVDWETWD